MLIFRVVVDDVNAFAGDVANVINVAKLARSRINQNIALVNFLAVVHDERTLFSLAEKCGNQRWDFAIVAHVNEDIRLKSSGILEVVIQNDFQIGVHKLPPNHFEAFYRKWVAASNIISRC